MAFHYMGRFAWYRPDHSQVLSFPFSAEAFENQHVEEFCAGTLHVSFCLFLPEFFGGYKVVMMLMVIGYLLHFIPREAELAAQETITNMPIAGKAAFMISVIILVIQTKSSGIQPFIYFQF